MKYWKQGFYDEYQEGSVEITDALQSAISWAV